MTIPKIISLTIIASTLGIATQGAMALEDLSAKELALYCKAHHEKQGNNNAKFCVRYVQGFIDGAIATDTQVMLNVEKEFEKKETFTERAMRTRMPSRGYPEKRATIYAKFCLGNTIELKNIVDNVANDLMSNRQMDTLLARDVVYDTLKKHYPCSTT